MAKSSIYTTLATHSRGTAIVAGGLLALIAIRIATRA